jgi:hypothetical protein
MRLAPNDQTGAAVTAAFASQCTRATSPVNGYPNDSLVKGFRSASLGQPRPAQRIIRLRALEEPAKAATK